MDAIVVEGGGALSGRIDISAAKNSVLPLMTAALLADGVSTISRIPGLADVRTLARLLTHLGAEATFENGGVSIDSRNISHLDAPYEMVKTMRASVLVLGPLAARFGKARISLPGGCAIGARPINLHLRGLELMGANVRLEHGYVEIKCNRLRGARIVLDIPTVTGVENLLMAACLAKGVTVIENAAREPEIVDLADCLTKMGAKISGAGTQIIEVEGVDSLRPFNHDPVPDRVEAGTMMIAAAISGGELTLRGARLDHLDSLVEKLKEVGTKIKLLNNGEIHVSCSGGIESVDIRTSPYPGFPTDMQAQFMALMSLGRGLSVITEKIFENRFMHVQELNRMGADISLEGGSAIVRGVKNLSGAKVMATDLRASAALVLAGLAAKGRTVISRVYHLDRGYESLEKKLAGAGANIWRASEVFK